MAADWDALRNLRRMGGLQIFRTSDAGIIGWSHLGDHQWSNLRSSAVWLCWADWSHTLELGELGGFYIISIIFRMTLDTNSDTWSFKYIQHSSIIVGGARLTVGGHIYVYDKC